MVARTTLKIIKKKSTAASYMSGGERERERERGGGGEVGFTQGYIQVKG